MLKALLGQLVPSRKAARQSAEPTPLQRAAALLAEKQWQQAGRLAVEILEEQPENVEAWLIQARSSRARGMLDEAKRAYRRALVLDPKRPEAWIDLGVCHHLTGDDFWARVYYRFARELDPNNAAAWNEFGVVEIRFGNFEQAERSLGNAVAHDPGLAEAWNNLGLVLARRGDLQNARRHFMRAVFLKPQHYTAHCNLGLACRELELPEQAAEALRRAIEIDPRAPTAHVNLAMVRHDQGLLNEAHELLQQARCAAPEDADVLSALSAVHLRRGEVGEAKAMAREALRLEPRNADAELALAHAYLAAGEFAAGWTHYEARLRSRHSPLAHLGFAPWRGEPLTGKSLLVYGEQGLGDEIMFASCLPDLLAQATRCTLLSSPRLAPLFRRSFPQLEVVDSAGALEAQHRHGERLFHFSMPIGSLPSIFRPDRAAFPSRRSFLRADEERTQQWRERLAALGPGLKVGLAWRGGIPRTGRVQRSLAFADLAPLLALPGVHWISLQHGRAAGEEHERLHAWDAVASEIDQAASLIAALDLVVTVCSTVVHLAGALGCPAWVLTPKAPAWRYLLQGECMPWYPGVRLLRQTSEGDWSTVVGQVRHDLSWLREGAQCLS